MLRKSWRVVDAALSGVEHFLILGLLSSILILAFAQVVARWFGGGWVWADELVRYLVLWLGIFGAAAATRQHKHIAIDAFARLLPSTLRRGVRRGIDLLAAATAFVFVKATIQYIGFVGDEHSATLGVTVGTLTWPLAVGFALIGIHFIADAIFGSKVDTAARRPPATSRGDVGEPDPLVTHSS